MLVLSRKSNQTIRIGGNIVLTVLEIRRSHVKIGLQAPPEVSIRRSELLEPAQTAKRHAWEQAVTHQPSQ